MICVCFIVNNNFTSFYINVLHLYIHTRARVLCVNRVILETFQKSVTIGNIPYFKGNQGLKKNSIYDI